MALKTSLVSYWNLDEASGNRADSHSSNNLTDVNTVASASDGLMGTVADFTSANSEGLNIADASQSGLDVTGDLTINLWIKLKTTPAGAFMVCSKWAHTTQNQYFCRIANASTGNFDFYTDSTCSGFGYTGFNRTYGTLGTTNWFMVTFKRSGTTGSIYVNGVLQGATATIETSANCTGVFSLGYEAGRDVSYYNGYMTRVGIWSKALSDSEITELYNSGNGMTYAQLDAVVSTFRPRVMAY